MSRRNQGPRLRWLDKRNAFYITWTEHGRSRERSTGTANRDKAQIVFAEWLIARGRKAGPRDPAEMLVTDLLNDYASERGPHVVAPRVIGCAVSALTTFWHGRFAADVTPHACRLYMDARGRSVNTVRRELNVLRTALNYAHKNGRLSRPVAIQLPDAPEPRERWLERPEAARLLRAALRSPKVRFYLPLFILLALYTGRRKQAILSLRWHQVNLDHGWINFEQGLRTNKRKGRIPIPPRLLPHLRRARLRSTTLGYVVNIDGERIGDIKKGFEAACMKAELHDVTPHILKHTAITWAMQNRMDLWQAAGYFATSVPILTRVYGHHHPDFMREAAEAIGRRPQNVRAMP
jgi:integrase